MKRTIAGLVLVLWAQAGWCEGSMSAASYLDGNSLLEYCAVPYPDGPICNPAQCLSYVQSAVDTHNAWVVWGHLQQKMCLPRGVTNEQLVKVVVKYLKEHPEELHLGAGGLVLNALTLAFPCK